MTTEELGELLRCRRSALYLRRPLPPGPTAAEPGSAEKIDVMRRRWADGYQIAHPDDATLAAYDDAVNTFARLIRDAARPARDTNGAHHKNGKLR